MDFRTLVPVKELEKKISYNSNALLIGSCFTENIGNKLVIYKFIVDINPFGVIYNPLSVRNGIEILIDQKEFNEKDLDYYNGQWLSFYHHGSFSNLDKNICLKNINDRINKASENLKSASFLFITFGTAWIFKSKETNNVVSNCHKIPAKFFERKLLKVPEIIDSFKNLINKLKTYNPELQIVFTVSPIRHLKDGAVENQVSKSTLILAINELRKHYENVNYFPAYEILMDELRDYRFYEDDMTHPNRTAINYLWHKFQEACIEKTSEKMMKEVEKIHQAKNHKPFNPDSDEHQKFLRTYLDKIEMLSKENRNIDFAEEKKIFEARLRE